MLPAASRPRPDGKPVIEKRPKGGWLVLFADGGIAVVLTWQSAIFWCTKRRLP